MSLYTDQDKQPDKARVFMKLRGQRRMYLDNPDPAVYDPYLDAQTLGCVNRYVGSYGPYSVAQHCVLVSRVVAKLTLGGNPGQEFAGLHHEDSEAVTGDLPQPVKSVCPDFKALEKRLQAAADVRYRIDSSEATIKEADRIVFCAEIRWLVPREQWEDYGFYGSPLYRAGLQPKPTELEVWSPDRAAKEFIELHDTLEALRSK